MFPSLGYKIQRNHKLLTKSFFWIMTFFGQSEEQCRHSAGHISRKLQETTNVISVTCGKTAKTNDEFFKLRKLSYACDHLDNGHSRGQMLGHLYMVPHQCPRYLKIKHTRTYIHTERERQTHTHIHTYTQRDTQTHRHTLTHTERERE